MKSKVDNLENLMRIKAMKEAVENNPLVFEIGEGDDKTVIEVARPKARDVLNVLNAVEDDEPAMNVWRSLTYMVFPELHQKNLLEEYGRLGNPEAIVDDFFLAGDIAKIGIAVRETITVGSIKEIKN